MYCIAFQLDRFCICSSSIHVFRKVIRIHGQTLQLSVSILSYFLFLVLYDVVALVLNKNVSSPPKLGTPKIEMKV